MRKLYLFLATLIIATSAFVLYGYYAVYRYPGLSVDPDPLPHQVSLAFGSEIKADGAYLKQKANLRFRAWRPDVSLQITPAEQDKDQLSVRVENIHPDATFSYRSDNPVQVSESRFGLLREVTISGLRSSEGLSLEWKFPLKSSYRFIAVGDTGADRELDWSLIRGAELGADFILNLGDLFYDKDELDDVGAHFNRSQVPVYVSNGNHDFRGPKGNAIDLFLQQVGPLNARFSLLGHCFINLDTGAFMFPPDKGERAALLAAEIASYRRDPSRCSDYTVFTHKPMVDKFETRFPKRKHSLHGRDARSLIRQLQQLGPVTVLAGHIHDDFVFRQDGMTTWVSGSGLAHADLARGTNVARLIVEEFSAGEPLSLGWALNKMPLEYHCSRKIYNSLKNDKPELAEEVRRACQL